MDPSQIAVLRTALNAIGLVQQNASDQDVLNAFAQYQAQNPAGAQTVLQQSGLASSGPSMLTILGLVGGAIALWLIWREYNKPKQVAAYDYPDEDAGPRLRRASKSLAALRGGAGKFGRHSLAGGCRSRMGKFGDVPGNRYEFEPELRLEGYRKRRARR